MRVRKKPRTYVFRRGWKDEGAGTSAPRSRSSCGGCATEVEKCLLAGARGRVSAGTDPGVVVVAVVVLVLVVAFAKRDWNWEWLEK